MWLILLLLAIFIAFFLTNFLLEKKNTAYGITFIAGQIGSGKSTYAVKLAMEHLKAGWNVYSTDYIKGCYKLNVEDLSDKMAEPKSLLIIDEASLKMNSRQFAKTKLELIEYFKLSRHCKNKIVMISQTFGDTDKQIRELSTKVYFIRRVINGVISVPVRVRGDIGVGQDGQPSVMYSIAHLGVPFFLPKYYRKFNSFDDFNRELISREPWDICEDK